jgi:hypothetical protein
MKKKWLFPVEVVTSHGSIDHNRQNELKDLFGKGDYNLVFDTQKSMAKFFDEIHWETVARVSKTKAIYSIEMESDSLVRLKRNNKNRNWLPFSKGNIP